MAGALANPSLAMLMFWLAVIPLRRGEKWDFWAYCTPFPVYGLPILFLDAANVPGQELFGTLLPQLLGLGVAATGLPVVRGPVFAAPTPSPNAGS